MHLGRHLAVRAARWPYRAGTRRRGRLRARCPWLAVRVVVCPAVVCRCAPAAALERAVAVARRCCRLEVVRWAARCRCWLALGRRMRAAQCVCRAGRRLVASAVTSMWPLGAVVVVVVMVIIASVRGR